jgi:HEAT repeat protein
MKYLTLSCCLVLLSAFSVSAQPEKSLPDTFNELLPKLDKDNAAQQKWQDICFKLGAPGNEKQRAEACALMCAKLDAKTPAGARVWLLTQLEHIGGEESVEPLAALLSDKDDVVREAAVRALANNPSPKATAKLTDALPKATGKAKIGLINALGHRGPISEAKEIRPAVKELKRELGGTDEAAAIAAARALGRIPTQSALSALDNGGADAKGAVLTAVYEAFLVHADRLRRIGEADTILARDIYRSLSAADKPKAIRLAAIRGIIQTDGDKAGDTILKILAGTDTAAQTVAVGQIEFLNAAALKTLAGSLDKLSVPNRVSVITAIAARGDRSLAPVALAAAKSIDADVRRAGLLALGRLGDASTVEFLLDAMSGKDATAGIAAESLARLTADGVDAKLVAVLAKEKTSARAITLIGVLESRKATTAVPALLTAAGGTDAAVRVAAFNALKTLASPGDVPGMVAALLKTAKGKERETAELAIAAVCSQLPKEKRAEAVLAAIKNGKNTTELLPLLGRLGGPDALKVIREHIAGSDPALRSAALTGLFNWPEATANDDLLALAEKDKEPATKLAALQALIRINCVLVDRTPEERLGVLNVMKKAMPLAGRDDERRALLSGIGFVRHIETLRFVLPYLDDPALAQAACKGVVELAHSKMLREPNKAEFDKALDRVIATCKDKGLADRAKQYKEGR